MQHTSISAKRFLATAGFAVAAIVAGAVPAMTGSGTPLAACTGGEEMDVYTTTCTPFLVPSSSQGFTSTAANPDIPEIDGIPCTGGDSGACIGLSENEAAAGPQPVPRSTISSSP